jgi:hypothetical protein
MTKKDSSHPNFNIPPPKKRPKSTWGKGFIVAKASQAIELYKGGFFVNYRKVKPTKSRGNDNG